MNDYRGQVEMAIQATVIHSATAYSWMGSPSRRLSPRLARSLGADATRAYLRFMLQAQLYADFYSQGQPTRSLGRNLAASIPISARTAFVESLSAANLGRDGWADGWVLREWSEGEALVERAGLRMRARPEDCQMPEDGDSGLPGIGREVRLRRPKELLPLSPGFYMALGDLALPSTDPGGLIRLYWHLTAEGAVPFVGHATRLLNDARVPFRLKVTNDPPLFTRADAAVIYLSKQDYSAAIAPLASLYDEVAAFLRPATPALTKSLAPGLGLAEDPLGGESFGMHRCRLLAEGLIRAHERGMRSTEERLQEVIARFAEEGIRLDAPYLNPGSTDCYDFPAVVRIESRPQSAGGPKGEPGDQIRSGTYLEVATRIGCRLVRDALWHGERCTWVGTVRDPRGGALVPGTCYETLGPDLYAGTSGVALFLAHLYAATGESAFRRTALGALRQALARADTLCAPHGLGLYTGRLGVALAAAHAASLLDADELVSPAAELARQSEFGHDDDGEFDLIYGRAGAVVALLALAGLLDQPELTERAAELGDDLIRYARESGRGCSWRMADVRAARDLTGFSHGAAGVAFALIELFKVTGEERYRATAERAFAYERHWFDADAGNWPDFRLEPGERPRTGMAFPCATTWCHGAPGIALSRLRAYSLLSDATCKAEAITALGTTAAAVEQTLQSGTGRFALCHGLAGNVDVLLYGAQVLGEEAPGAGLAADVAASAARYAAGDAPWPCGLPGEPPGLMLGLAGIGYFYLRLHNPTIPTPLLVEPERLARCGAEMAPRARTAHLG